MSNDLNVPSELMDQINALNAEMSGEDAPAVEEKKEVAQDSLQAMVNELPEEVEEQEPEVLAEEIVAEEVAPELSEEEEKAYKMGWRPKDQYQDTPEDFVDASEYIARGPFIKQLKKQKDELSLLKSGMQELTKSHQADKARVREETIRELQAQKEAAYRVGNTQAASDLDKDHIALLREQEDFNNSNPQEVEHQDINSMIKATPEWDSFITESEWAGSPKADHVRLQAKGLDLVQQYLDVTGEANFTADNAGELVKFVKEGLAPKVNPNPNRQRAASVASPSNKGAGASAKAPNSTKHPEYGNLNAIQKITAQTCCIGPDATMTMDDYVQSLKSNGSLKSNK